uniref:Flavodoxin-like domain-containing protein n=2 Tax=Phaeomonas parva TaxID=124430 RepID=A0A7S1XK27_9STRA|mmetsp:Transcript_10331/g.30932  ORF Transcript_10331/g.30932 Transcript_10331/m.30932 type:complete len:214 (+) Transcript_10331:254-895(+)
MFTSTFKILIGLVLCASSARGFGRLPAKVPRKSMALNAVGLLYSTSTGNTETVGGYIFDAAKAAGVDVSELTEVGDAANDAVEGFDGLIVGAPTWHTGADEERSGTTWDDWLYKTLPNLNLDGKKVAVFGVGDQQSYCDNYCDAAGELYDQFKAAGCTIVGMTSTDGYEHTESKAEVDGKFVGMMFDEDNEYDKSEGRAKEWIDQLKGEGLFA